MASDSSSSSDSSDQSNTSGTFAQFVEEYSEEELATILIIGGVFMFFVPGLQFFGALALLIGVITWFSDWLWG